MNLKMGAGGLLALLGVAAVLLTAALRWFGANAALIGRGIWAFGEVVFAGAVLYAAGTLAWRVYQARHAPAAEPAAQPAPVHVASEQVPLALPPVSADRRLQIEARARADFEEYMRHLRAELELTRGDDL